MHSRTPLFIGMFLTVFLMVAALPLAEAQYGIVVTPGKGVYTQGETVSVVAVVAPESLVSFQIKDPSGNTLLVRTLQAEQGTAILSFLLDLEAETGTYTISVSAVSASGEDRASASGIFQLSEEELEGDEVGFIPSFTLPPLLLALGLTGALVSFFRTRRN